MPSKGNQKGRRITVARTEKRGKYQAKVGGGPFGKEGGEEGKAQGTFGDAMKITHTSL